MDKVSIYARALQKHKKGGRVLKALDKAFAAPDGINKMLVFLYAMKGTPYGHVDMCMDKVVDCAELPRIAIWIFFGIDIGNSSHSQYINPAGKVITKNWNDLPKCRPLTLAFYDTDDKRTAIRRDGEDHVAVVYDAKHLIQSGAKVTGSKVGLTPILWHPADYDGHFLCAKDFLSDEQYNSLMGEEGKEVINKNSEVAEKKEVQKTLIALGFKGDMDEANLGEWGSRTEKALNAFQTSVNLPIKNEVDPATAAAMFKALREKAVNAEANYAGYQGRVSTYISGIKTAVNMKI